MLFCACARGDDAAFAPVVEESRRRGYAFACRLVRSPEAARDVLQEAYIRLWRHRHRYDGRVAFTTWFYQIVARLCYDQLKRDRRRRHALEQLQLERGAEDGAPEVERAEWLAQLMELTRRLPPRQQLILVLRDLEDLEMAEIEQITGLTAGAIKSNLYYARKALYKLSKKAGLC